MNNIFSIKGVSVLLGLAAIAVAGTAIPANAETATTSSSEQSATVVVPAPEATAPVAENQAPTVDTHFQLSETAPAVQQQESTTVQPQQEFPDSQTQASETTKTTPVPGTIPTSSAALTPEQTTFQLSPVASPVAQADIDPGRPTRGGSSYVGIGGNIGIGGGDSALGDGNFTILSKVGVTRTFSVRPSIILGDNTTIVVPVTYDFNLQQLNDPFADPLPIAPYVGAGAAIKTGDDSQLGFLLSAGVDVPLTRKFTATAAVNAGFFDDTDVGLLLGVGYNFRGF